MNNVSPIRKEEVVMGFRMKNRDDKKDRIMRWHVIGGLCLQAGFRRGAEIGVSQGRFTMFLCAIMHDMEVIAVDRWERTAGLHPSEGWSGLESRRKPQALPRRPARNIFRSVSPSFAPIVSKRPRASKMGHWISSLSTPIIPMRAAPPILPRGRQKFAWAAWWRAMITI